MPVSNLADRFRIGEYNGIAFRPAPELDGQEIWTSFVQTQNPAGIEEDDPSQIGASRIIWP